VPSTTQAVLIEMEMDQKISKVRPRPNFMIRHQRKTRLPHHFRGPARGSAIPRSRFKILHALKIIWSAPRSSKQSRTAKGMPPA